MNYKKTKKTVLVIEDEVPMLEMILRVLEEGLGEGYGVISAETRDQGYELVRKSRPDLILSDWGMKGLEEFTDKVREVYNPPIIVMTGNREGVDELKEKINPNAILLKPFKNIWDLSNKVREYLE